MVGEFVVEGVAYSLAHLQVPVMRKIPVALRGFAQKKSVLVEFHFSNHCYSRGPSEGEVIQKDLLVLDGSKRHPRNRIFDIRRHQLSLGLVGHIDALIATDGEVRNSRHDNFFSVQGALEKTAGVSTVVDYFIFMNARKVANPGQEKRIKIFVESAYPESPNVPFPNSMNTRIFSELLGSVWSGR
jgi:hypothetical protein